MRKGLPSGDVTFFFSDVEGSTRLLRELGAEAYAERLADHRRVVRAACSSRGGIEVDTQGDAFFFAFRSAADAVEAARAVTNELASGPIAVRIGLHSGKPLVTDEGYVGEDVHVAARVAASAHGGQVVLSLATREVLATQQPLVELGEHRFKDIDSPIAIYQIGERAFPPLKTISNTNLPRAASSFIGRESELAEVVTRIRSGARLVTLTGPGGSGKTRLALEAASVLVSEYKDGVFWVGLASLRDPALVADVIAQTLGAKEKLADHLAERHVLLLLDNLEQVVEAAPELAGLLQACPRLTLLITSRELLRVEGEVRFLVPPLADAEAVSLFSDRAQLSADDTVAQLCRRLDCLPLAVELAAARATALAPRQILERLGDRLDLLKGGRDASPRHQTLRATIDWSYDLLSARERSVFRGMAVFAGGCTFDAAEQIADGDVDTFQSLVDKSLLRFTRERYWMLETIREFAYERLVAASEEEALRQRHAEYFRRVAEEAAGQFHGEARAVWSARLGPEHANLRAALEFWRHAPDVQLGMAAAIWPLWWQEGSWREAQRWLDEALAASSDRGDRRLAALEGAYYLAYLHGDAARARMLLDDTLALARERQNREAIAYALHGLANLAAGEADYDQWLALDTESLEFSAGLRHELYPLGSLGWIAFVHEGDCAKARALCERAIAVGRRFGDDVEVARELARLATIMAFCGDANAEAMLRESVELAQKVGASAILANNCLLALAVLRSVQGDPERSLMLLGAGEALTAAMGAGPGSGPVVREIRRRVVEAAEQTLQSDEIALSRETGRSLSLDEAVSVGLDGRVRDGFGRRLITRVGGSA